MHADSLTASTAGREVVNAHSKRLASQKMRILTTLLAFVVLAACISPAPRYTTDPGHTALTQDQAQLQLLERAIQLQTKNRNFDAPIKLLYAPLPDYPDDLRRANVQGNVRIKFTVEENGTVSHLEIIGTPPEPLATRCLEVLNQWRFEPATVAGKPTRVQIIQPFKFELAEKK